MSKVTLERSSRLRHVPPGTYKVQVVRETYHPPRRPIDLRGRSPNERFRVIWDALASRGICDARPGAEYSRIHALWAHKYKSYPHAGWGQANQINNFIRTHANATATLSKVLITIPTMTSILKTPSVHRILAPRIGDQILITAMTEPPLYTTVRSIEAYDTQRKAFWVRTEILGEVTAAAPQPKCTCDPGEDEENEDCPIHGDNVDEDDDEDTPRKIEERALALVTSLMRGQGAPWHIVNPKTAKRPRKTRITKKSHTKKARKTVKPTAEVAV